MLRYLRSTADVGLRCSTHDEAISVIGYSDADWASAKDDRKSVSGVLVLLNGAPVVFRTQQQRTVALSTAEAKYMALSLCVQEVV